ncbi:MAG: cytochrome C biogenesis protein [Lawsonibacter sp.]|nr:cytochrome C biogenesis protein [Lawsonibacter sp.]
MEAAVYKLEIFVPERHLDRIFQALWSVDAGHIGKYDRCLSWSRVSSCWRPLEGADPYDGVVGQLFQREEIKVEVCCWAQRLEETLNAVKTAHPYEEPVINVLPLKKTGL